MTPYFLKDHANVKRDNGNVVCILRIYDFYQVDKVVGLKET